MKKVLLPTFKKMIHETAVNSSKDFKIAWEILDDQIAVQVDPGMMMIIDLDPEWISFLSSYNDPVPGMFGSVTRFIRMFGISDEVDIKSFVHEGDLWIYEPDRSIKFANKYMRYFVSSDLDYDLVYFQNGYYLLMVYEFDKKCDDYCKVAIIMGVK